MYMYLHNIFAWQFQLSKPPDYTEVEKKEYTKLTITKPIEATEFRKRLSEEQIDDDEA